MADWASPRFAASAAERPAHRDVIIRVPGRRCPASMSGVGGKSRHRCKKLVIGSLLGSMAPAVEGAHSLRSLLVSFC